MSKLFIIGNGFDLSHGLKTRYEDFHRYLKHRFPDSIEDQIVIPDRQIGRHGEERYDEDEVVSLLRYLISESVNWGDRWGDVEAALGSLNLTECFEDLSRSVDKEGDLNLTHQQYNNQDRATELTGAVPRITDYFTDWIETVEINGVPKRDFQGIMDPKNDLFLSFNYTDTLETLYRAEHVCHIHGRKGDPLLFGHGIDRDFEHDPNTPIGAEYGLQAIHDALRKNTRAAIETHWDFFEMISPDISEIYSYGFSFSDVDKPYIKIVCQRLKTEYATWHFNDFDSKRNLKRYQKSAMGCGFLGRFDFFHIV